MCSSVTIRRGRLTRVNAEDALQSLQDRVAAHHRTQGVGADADKIFAGRARRYIE